MATAQTSEQERLTTGLCGHSNPGQSVRQLRDDSPQHVFGGLHQTRVVHGAIRQLGATPCPTAVHAEAAHAAGGSPQSHAGCGAVRDAWGTQSHTQASNKLSKRTTVAVTENTSVPSIAQLLVMQQQSRTHGEV